MKLIKNPHNSPVDIPLGVLRVPSMGEVVLPDLAELVMTQVGALFEAGALEMVEVEAEPEASEPILDEPKAAKKVSAK